MNGYEVFGRAVTNAIIYFIGSAFLGLIICGIFTNNGMGGIDLDSFPKCAWIGGCIVCVMMILYKRIY